MAGLGWLTVPALVISHLYGSAAYHGLTTRQIALFEDNSVDGETAVWIAAVAGLVVFVWRLLSGWLCDLRGSGPVMWLAAPAGLLTFATLVAILVTANVAALFFYPSCSASLSAASRSCRQPRPPPRPLRPLGVCRLASGAGMAAGPVIAGSLHALAGGYGVATAVIAGLALLHVAAFAAIRRRPARTEA